MRYLRSLSFIQGTAVNLLRTSIMFLMLYLIYTRAITVGQFFSLFIYSFFIFGPLQELGNVINVYRETEASLNVYEDILQMPKEPKPANPVPLDELQTLAFERVTFQHQSAIIAGGQRHLVQRAARRDDRVRRAVGRRQDDAGQAAGRALSAAVRADPLQRHRRAARSTSTACARASASSPRTRSSSPARSARTCCS